MKWMVITSYWAYAFDGVMRVGGKGERINPVASIIISLNLQVEEDFVFVYLSLDLWSQTDVTPDMVRWKNNNYYPVHISVHPETT